jgi:hypothetical protein
VWTPAVYEFEGIEEIYGNLLILGDNNFHHLLYLLCFRGTEIAYYLYAYVAESAKTLTREVKYEERVFIFGFDGDFSDNLNCFG